MLSSSHEHGQRKDYALRRRPEPFMIVSGHMATQ